MVHQRLIGQSREHSKTSMQTRLQSRTGRLYGLHERSVVQTT